MHDHKAELQELCDRLREIEAEFSTKDTEAVESLIQGAMRVGKAWSKSWLGYQAYVYYEDFQMPPPGAQFSVLDGLAQRWSPETRGRWVEMDPDEIQAAIVQSIGASEYEALVEKTERTSKAIRQIVDETKFVLDAIDSGRQVGWIKTTLERLEEAKPQHASRYIGEHKPPSPIPVGGDTRAMSGGVVRPVHFIVLANAKSLRSTLQSPESLIQIIETAMRQLDRERRMGLAAETKEPGTKIFIGHGQSLLWRELASFLHDRLFLDYDEFKRKPSAGLATTTRLSQMLDNAKFAFVVMTAEDETADGEMRPRMNVVHEAGLFQGRLGFERAIILLEDGCDEFSNIVGLTQIRFPKGKISAAFEEIRHTLEERGIISPQLPTTPATDAKPETAT